MLDQTWILVTVHKLPECTERYTSYPERLETATDDAPVYTAEQIAAETALVESLGAYCNDDSPV